MTSILKILDFYFRLIVLLLSITVVFAFLFASAKTALAANLRSSSVITDNVLTLGDVFDGLGADKASYVLGPAPLPGQDMTLNARTLMRVALAMDLPWQPHSTADQITIRRAATLIDETLITKALTEGLHEKGVKGRFNLDFGSIKPELVIPHDQEAHVEITALQFDPQQGRFEAILMAPSAQNPAVQMKISGRVERLIPVPVLRKPLRAGEIIGSYDIEWLELRARDVQHDIILNADELLNMTPRRMVMTGKPIRITELEQPQLVGRGDTISILYKNGPLTLSAKGKALQNGAKGDFVRIVNLASNRSIEGFVTGDHEVTIQP